MPEYPAIPEPSPDIDNLAEVARALKEAVEIISGKFGVSPLTQTIIDNLNERSDGTAANIKVSQAAFADELDPAYLDEILDRAAENAALLTEELQRDSRTAITELRTLIQDFFNVDLEGAVYQQIIDLEQSVGNNSASITSEALARVTADTAIAGRIDEIEVQVDDNTAAITQETVARADGDTALATSITSLQTSVNSNTAAITQEISARSTADSAIAADISSLQTSVGTNTASISSIQTAYTTADTALSNRVDSVEAIAEAGTADGYYRLTAVSNPADGAAAEFAVEVKAGSTSSFASAGMRLQAFSNGTSRVKFLVDQFIVSDSSGSYIPFTISSGKLLANALEISASDVGGLGALGLIDKLTDANLATYMDTGVIRTAYIGDAEITSAKIASIDAGKIDAEDLSSISANLGTITTGRIQNLAGSIDINLASNYVDILATGFKLRDSTSSSGVAPFYVDGGVTYIEDARIKRGVVSQLASATVGNSGVGGTTYTISTSVNLTLRAGATVTILGVFTAKRGFNDVGIYAAGTINIKRSTTVLKSIGALSARNDYFDSTNGNEYKAYAIDSTVLTTYTALSSGSNTFSIELNVPTYSVYDWLDSLSIMVVEYNK